MRLPALALKGIEVAINQYLQLDPDTTERLSRLAGKVVGIQFRGWNITFYLQMVIDGIKVLEHYDDEVDAEIIGTPISIAKLSIQKTSNKELFGNEVEIKGDVSLGREIQDILNKMDIDWEEKLSRFTGDIVAHQVGNAVRHSVGWTKNAIDTIGQNIAEYLHEESEDLPRRDEIDHFLTDVDTIRADIDRLEAKVKRLHARAANS